MTTTHYFTYTAIRLQWQFQLSKISQQMVMYMKTDITYGTPSVYLKQGSTTYLCHGCISIWDVRVCQKRLYCCYTMFQHIQRNMSWNQTMVKYLWNICHLMWLLWFNQWIGEQLSHWKDITGNLIYRNIMISKRSWRSSLFDTIMSCHMPGIWLSDKKKNSSWSQNWW
jgi:hypothetical protein